MCDLAFFPNSFPRWLPHYFPHVRVIALGEAGDTTADVLGRCRPAGIVDYVRIAKLYHHQPHPVRPGRYCSVLAGVNDLLSLHDSADTIIAHLTRIYAYLHRHDSTPFPITILPYRRSDEFRPSRERIRLEVNTWIRRQPQAIDVEHLMGDGQTPPALKRRFDGGDGLHPVGEGPKVLARAVAKKMISYRHRSGWVQSAQVAAAERTRLRSGGSGFGSRSSQVCAS